MTNDEIDQLLYEIGTTLKKKNHDYGNSTKWWRLTTFTDMIVSKWERVRTLENLKIAGKTPLVDESHEDAYWDALGYTILALKRFREQK
jgi:hypothetical protein